MRYLGRDFLLAKKLLNWEFRVALPNRSTDIKTVSKEVLQPYYKILLFNFEFFCYGNAHCINCRRIFACPAALFLNQRFTTVIPTQYRRGKWGLVHGLCFGLPVFAKRS